MKLIATLATLAALVGQTEAAASAATVIVDSVKVGNAPCTDEIVLKATTSVAVAATEKLSFSSSKLSTKKTATGELQTVSAAKCKLASGDNADASGILTVVTAAEASGVTTWEWTALAGSAGCTASGDVTVTLINVCNNGVTDYSGKAHDLKYKAGATTNTVLDSAQTATSTDKIVTPPAALASFAVTEMPVEKSQTGKFTATFTGVAALNGKKLVLNLPEGYTIPKGAKCSIKKTADATAKVITAASDGGLADECTNTCVFSVVAIPTSTLADATEATFSCDKVTSGKTVPAPADGDVALKAQDATSLVNSHVGYAKSKSAAPTKSPTAKAADSPASVATASGVVVGALGVAALFLA